MAATLNKVFVSLKSKTKRITRWIRNITFVKQTELSLVKIKL